MTMDHIKPTKRKPNIHELAAMAMQGLLSNPRYYDSLECVLDEDDGIYIVADAFTDFLPLYTYKIAEAMIKEGEKRDS